MTSTILYHSLTSAGGHKVSVKQNLLASLSRTFSNDRVEIWCVEAIAAEHPDAIFERDYEILRKKRFQRWHAFGRLWIDLTQTWYWFKLGMMIDTVALYIFILV